ncbi:Signal transduction histidine kinase [Arachidicoccus rhizosphaerae]|uniref:histidine kinase n=1 Tax=Arachidicoccus rhizosphaerae TaxID=551991 RepID=A0A1H4D205_9BACT|nr:HAMP domain-containing sensor histidine kinase [Arachidicoccus rhizosphaerae]SEA66744.1 Signal transduction histidine kinase [Arachidicoccus rhizosphaerae]
MKLLNYTSLRHLLFASLLTLISIPVFYVLLNDIFVRSIDRDLKMQAAQIPTMVSIIQNQKDLELWKELDNDLEVLPLDSVQFHERPFTRQESLPNHKGDEDFRILQKKLQIMGQPYVVSIKASLFEKEDLIRTILTIQFGILILLLIGTVGINYFVHKRIWKPFYNSLDYLRQFNIESEISPLPAPLKIQEFTQLNQSIEQLSVRVRQTYFSQKEFIENASHELQTPLTVLKFKLELLLQTKDLTGEQGELVGDMYREIEQMQELNSNLLLLSKIENGQFISDEDIDVEASIAELIDNLSLLAEAKGQILLFIEQKYPHPKPLLLKRANPMLFKIMIANLLTNAIQYSSSGATIKIDLKEDSLIIANPGSPLNIPKSKLFTRFVRTGKKSKGQNKSGLHNGGNGLGLSIASRIASYHKNLSMTLDYLYNEENKEHNFIIHWLNVN